MKILPFINEFLAAMQKDCTVWYYLCSKLIKTVYE